MTNDPAKKIKSPDLGYCIQAMGLAGNILLQGHSSPPPRLNTDAAAANTKIADSRAPAPIETKSDREDGIGKRAWIGLGSVVVGAAASRAGSGGGDSTTTMTIDATKPGKGHLITKFYNGILI